MKPTLTHRQLVASVEELRDEAEKDANDLRVAAMKQLLRLLQNL